MTSIWVRGDLGPCTIWTTPDGHGGVRARNPASKVYEQDAWRCVYERDHGPSFDEFVEMRLDEPVRLERGKKTGFYVHSKSQGDRAVVYDDQRYGTRGVVDDGRLVIWPAVAHLSCRPFGRRAPWGGDALRSNRLFVGRVAYGVRWLLWNPEPRCHARFPAGFRQAVETMVLCARRPGCELSRLGDEVIFYIMNKCGWDWFGENMTADGPSFEERKAAEQEAYRAREREERRHALRQMFGEGMSDQEVENLMEQVDDNPNLNYMLLNYLGAETKTTTTTTATTTVRRSGTLTTTTTTTTTTRRSGTLTTTTTTTTTTTVPTTTMTTGPTVPRTSRRPTAATTTTMRTGRNPPPWTRTRESRTRRTRTNIPARRAMNKQRRRVFYQSRTYE